jgi:hypothetical protein
MMLYWPGGILTEEGETAEDAAQRRDHKLACYYPQPHNA